MALLVFDTATEVLAAGLSEPLETISLPQPSPSLLVTKTSRVPRGHSVLLQPSIQELFQSTGTKPSDLSAVAVGIGPGSYTGVRLGVSTAKAMAFALSIPLYPVSTLWAIAAAALPGVTASPELVISLLYARRQRAFGAIFEKHGSTWTRLVPDKVQPVMDWMEEYRWVQRDRGSRTSTLIHDFRPHYQLEEIIQQFSPDLSLTVAECAGMLPQGLAAVWASGAAEPREGEEIHLVEPGYALEVEAEVKLKEAKARGGKGE